MNYQAVDVLYVSDKLFITCLPKFGQYFPHLSYFAVILVKYETFRKSWSYCTQICVITNDYS